MAQLINILLHQSISFIIPCHLSYHNKGLSSQQYKFEGYYNLEAGGEIVDVGR